MTALAYGETVARVTNFSGVDLAMHMRLAQDHQVWLSKKKKPTAPILQKITQEHGTIWMSDYRASRTLSKR